LRANSKSRWSWAGTLITAPVPYSARTKFAIQTGTASPVYGFTAVAPVKTPSFGADSPVRSTASVFFMRATNASTSARRSGDVTRAMSGCSGARTT
jgi:hypothetical protein